MLLLHGFYPLSFLANSITIMRGHLEVYQPAFNPVGKIQQN